MCFSFCDVDVLEHHLTHIGLRDEPDVKFSVVNTNQSTPSDGTQTSELKVVYRINITHECCCRNATEDCRAGAVCRRWCL